MATKSKAAPAEETVKTEEQEEKAVTEMAAEVKDPWEEKVKMIVPRKPKGEEQFYYICINDRRFQIPADGKQQEMPKPVALVLQESLEAEYEADDYADHIPNRDGSNPQVVIK